MIKAIEGGGVIITGADDIQRARMLALRGRMKLELTGIKFRGRTTYAIVKQEFGLHGTRQSVYAQFCKMHGLEE